MNKTVFSELAKSVESYMTNKKGEYDQGKAQEYLEKLAEKVENVAINKADKMIKEAIKSAKAVRPKALPTPTTKNYLLSIDGGGTRGIMPAIWLKNIEKDTGRKISEIFTVVGGTSIGGILALAATLPQPSTTTNQARAASTLEEIFTQHASEIFPPEDRDSIKSRLFRWATSADVRFNTYNRGPLENLLKDYLGNTTTLGSALSNIKVTSVTTKHDPVCFSNSKNPTEKAWAVGCATSAAPSYFAAATIGVEQYVDGGIWANNPAAVILADELASPNTSDDLKNYVVLSFGTGLMPVTAPFPSDIDGIKDGLKIAAPVLSALMTTHSVGVDRYLNGVLNKTSNINYVRVNPNIDKEIKLDSIEDRVFKDLRDIAEAEYVKKKSQIMALLAPKVAELNKKDQLDKPKLFHISHKRKRGRSSHYS
jgi:patatin-like phospholipase/acyl hydrolase